MNRSRVDVSAQILQSAAGGSTRIRIQYNTFLSHSHLDAYLQKLKEGGLLEHVDTLNTFKTTDAGHRFLKLYNQIVECIDPEQFGVSAASERATVFGSMIKMGPGLPFNRPAKKQVST